MYHQFKQRPTWDHRDADGESADHPTDIMGGIRVDAISQMSTSAGAVRRRRLAPACIGANGWAELRCRICWCSASAPASTRPSSQGTPAPQICAGQIESAARATMARVRARREPPDGEGPYKIPSTKLQT